MINPYQSPTSKLHAIQVGSRRYDHVLIALLSGMLFPPALRLMATLLLFGSESPDLRGNISFWSSVIGGSIIASVFALQFQRMPRWLAFLLGLSGVALCLAGWGVWYAINAA